MMKLVFEIDLRQFELTELTAHVAWALVTGWIPLTVTTQAPQPPSKHMNFVPFNKA
jgi:hypothetical protein